MTYNYYTFRCISAEIAETDNELKQIFSAGDLTLICTLLFDTDEASDTYNHWICGLDVVSDTEDIPERSFTLYPNTLHFVGDDRYIVSVTTELSEIGHDDLLNVFLNIGVPSDE